MVNKKAKEVLERLKKENETFTIQIKGNEENKDDAFGILSRTQHLFCTKGETYHGIKKNTLDLLDEAEIKYKVI